MSSANLPRPRNRRSSSLRGRDAPTQLPPPFFFSFAPFPSATIFAASANISRTGVSAPHGLSQRRLHAVYQFLNLFLAQWFEQSTGYGREAAEDLGLSLPSDFGSVCDRAQIEPSDYSDVPTSNCSLSFILRAVRPIGLRQFQLHVGAAFDVRNAHVHLECEMCGVQHRQILKIREQRCKSIGVGEEGIDLVGIFLDLELAGKLDRHFRLPSYSEPRVRWP